LDDGSAVEVVDVSFKDNNMMIKKSLSNLSAASSVDTKDYPLQNLTCTVTFYATKPVCFSTYIEFSAGEVR
jgi:hypothetical protein